MIKNRKDGIYYFLIVVSYFVITIFPLLNQQIKIIDYLSFGISILIVTVSYFIPLIEGFILSLFISFIYSGYNIWMVRSRDSTEWLFWVGSFILGALISGKIGEAVDEVEKLKNFYKESVDKSIIENIKTGIGNERGFYLRFTREISASKRYGHSLGVIAVELQYYKELAVIKGKEKQGMVLAEISKALSRATRMEDEIFQIDKDLFFIVVINTDKEGIRLVEKRIKGKTKRVKLEDEEYSLKVKTAWEEWKGGRTVDAKLPLDTVFHKLNGWEEDKTMDAIHMKKILKRKLEYDV